MVKGAKMKTPTIQQEYDSYIDMLYNEDISETQYNELRKAYYAGCSFTYNVFHNGSQIDISEGKEMIKSLREQINSFAIGESEK